MATLYFNNAVNTDLGEAGNWWDDAGFTDPAGRVATTGDTGIVAFDATLNGSDLCHPDLMTISGGTFTAPVNVGTSISITTGATIAAGASITSPTISISGTVMIVDGEFFGDVTLANSVENNADITGSLLMTGASANNETVNGNVINSGTGNNFGVINGNYTITGAGENTGTVTGILTVPGTQSGNKITCNLTEFNLGSFGSLVISGIAAGGGGPLGGPAIEF